jgi:RNA polymerase sigma-70 factor (ECF subfamily)
MTEEHSAGLLRRLAGGDARALAEFYDAHGALAYGLALRVLRDRADAEDVTQEAFLQVWRQATRYDPQRGSAQAWLCAIVRTRALDRLRRRLARRETDEAPADGGAPPPDHESKLAVRKALLALSPDQRHAVELAYYEGLTQTEIASRLGAPLGTVKTRIRTAMLRLREELERD